jgi:tRNA uridine 5-carboxymethylaminomethyl modification enzyme
VSDERWELFDRRRARLEKNRNALERTVVRTATGGSTPAGLLLRQPGTTLEQLMVLGAPIEISAESGAVDMATLETTVKYEGYLRRQQGEVERARREERRPIPPGFPFARVPGLTREVVQRLQHVQPTTLGQAQRVPGVTPAAVSVLSTYLGRFSRSASEQTL